MINVIQSFKMITSDSKKMPIHNLNLISRKICVAKMFINNCTRTEVGETSYLLGMGMDFSTD